MKQVVIASGKGGTGKTTLTALLASIAATHTRIAMADADVEGSNLPIAFAATSSACTEFEGRSVARIDATLCSGCGLCEQVCRFEVPVFDFERAVFSIDPWACEGCGACTKACPLGAVALVAGRAGQVCSGSTPIGPIAFGELAPGEDQSGRLVGDVRKLGAAEGDTHGAEVLLIDGPPGIGCPATAAIADADLLVAVTEPTVSGAHDLARLIELAAGLNVPVRVVLNKADLSPEGAQRMRGLCATKALPLIAEIPFDPMLADLSAIAGAAGDAAGLDRLAPSVSAVWRDVSAALGLG